jgi:hypothetical protein
MPEYCFTPGRRGNYRTRIYRQGLRYLRKVKLSNEGILLLAHLTERTYSDVLLDILRAEKDEYKEIE